ncbi:MAG: hypothetical protein R6V04_02600 [bacterium]
MDFFKKSKLSTWVIGILITLNIITLAYLWIIRLHEHPEPSFRTQQREHKVVGMLQKELGLTPEQCQKFYSKRKIHFNHIQNLNKNILELKREMLEESFSTPVDSVRIHELARKIGSLQTEKEIETVYHFNKLHKVCNQEQQCRFRSLMDDILLPEHGHERPDCPNGRGRQSGLSKPATGAPKQ